MTADGASRADSIAHARRFDPFAPDLIRAPFPAYAMLHQSERMTRHDATESWVAARYRHVTEVLQNPVFVPNGIADFIGSVGRRSGRDLTYLERLVRAILFFDNTDEHKIRRRYFSRVLNDRPLSSFEPLLNDLVGDLVAEVRGRGRFDMVHDFADLVPQRFMMGMLGIPEEARQLLADSVLNALVAFNQGCSLAEYVAVDARLRAGIEYIQDLVRERQRRPTDDGISRMIALADAEREDARLLADRAYFLLFAGIETTSTLIANAAYLLHRNPEEMRKLKDGRAAPAAAVEEVLRYASPVVLSIRVATQPTTLDGIPMETGDSVVVLMQAANLDPAIFPDPERFDVGRGPSKHLAFATGGHFCIGASLARLEGRIALEWLLRLPPMRLADTAVTWAPFQSVRRIQALPFEFV